MNSGSFCFSSSSLAASWEPLGGVSTKPSCAAGLSSPAQGGEFRVRSCSVRPSRPRGAEAPRLAYYALRTPSYMARHLCLPQIAEHISSPVVNRQQ